MNLACLAASLPGSTRHDEKSGYMQPSMEPVLFNARLVDQLDRLINECEELRDVTLKQAEDAIKVLTELGYRYRLAQDLHNRAATDSKLPRKPRADQDCPVCGFHTDPPHDRRSHRSQTVKAPFTDAELAAKGLRRLPGAET